MSEGAPFAPEVEPAGFPLSILFGYFLSCERKYRPRQGAPCHPPAGGYLPFAARMNSRNSGCARLGRDFSSGWNCPAANQG